jgi:hypothetical protein
MHGKIIIKLVNLYISLGMGYKNSFNYIQYTQIPLAFLFNQIKNHPKVVYKILVAWGGINQGLRFSIFCSTGSPWMVQALCGWG